MLRILVLLSAVFLVINGFNWRPPCSSISAVTKGTNCSCKSSTYTCRCHHTDTGCRPTAGGLVPQCYSESEKCDGYNNCGDWSDERNCSCSSSQFECACHATVSGCNIDTLNAGVSHCISKHRQCDGYSNCGDSSDERYCPCNFNEVPCDCFYKKDCTPLYKPTCYHKQTKCNGMIDCADGSDEKNCVHDYECDCNKNNKTCPDGALGFYNRHSKCNEVNDCGDWSDEVNCTCGEGYFECLCNNTDVGTVDGCITRRHQIYRCYVPQGKCDLYNDCGDWSDEINCTYDYECDCRKNNQICPGGGIGAYNRGRKCNSFNNCGDWSDEKNCTGYKCSRYSTMCDKPCQSADCPPLELGIPQCFYVAHRCNQQGDCGDWSDEKNCTCGPNQLDCGCLTGSRNCSTGIGCVSTNRILNGFINCVDSLDEPCGSTRFSNYDRMFLCKSQDLYDRMLLIQSKNSLEPFVCHNVTIYSADTRHHNEQWCHQKYKDARDAVRCTNGDFIEGIDFCSGGNICKATEKRNYPGFKCKAKRKFKQTSESCVLPQINLYDPFSFCADESDICFVNGRLKCFKCLDGKLLLSPNQVCNGIIDCYDLSDECLCGVQTTCSEVLGNSRQVCRTNEMLCNGKCMATSEILCNATIKCKNNVNLEHCSPPEKGQGNSSHIICKVNDKNQERYVRKCDGIPECWNREDECVDCSVESHFCEDDIICHHDLLLNSMKYCDGKEKREGLGKFSWKCKHGFDEINCTNRFYCRSGSLISISKNYLCDGDNNCDDQSDELKSICKYRRFYCVNGTPHSVGVSKVENGIKDCSDGSDECPANSNKSSIFSSPYEMIANPFLRGIIWFMGLVAMLGNSVIFVTSVIEFKNSTSGTAVANHLFILNLSFSDFLMSVYLLSISIKGVMFSGSYCYHDLEWRSSGLCSFLGALVVISTEASALIMTVMTTFRLLTAWNPIGMNHVEWKQLCLPLIVVWIISVFIGTFPLINKSGYFVSSIWFPNYFYSQQSMRKADINQLIGRIQMYSNRTFEKLDWYTMKSTLEIVFESLKIKGEFGYYGETSVCMPRLFVKVGDTAWEYSTFLITLNFCMFLYMVISYVIIYKQGTKMNKSGQKQRNRNLQKRISRLIVTDFLCWIPLCILAYTNLAGVPLNNIVYVISAAILLPINCTINPLLYSKQLEDLISKLFKSSKSVFKSDNNTTETSL